MFDDDLPPGFTVMDQAGSGDLPPGFSVVSAGGAQSYQSSFYDNLESSLEDEYGLPSGLMGRIRTRGERSNADEVSPAGARSVYQIIPSTRAAFRKKYGIDAYSSPENAARVAALHLRESIERGGDPVREYHGGTNPDNWGPVNDAYAARVGKVSAAGITGDGLAQVARGLFGVTPARAATVPAQDGLPEGFAVAQEPPPDETADRIATIEQGFAAGDWTREEADRLIEGIKTGQAPLVSTATHGRAFFDELPEEVASKLSPQQVGAWQALARNPSSTPQQLEAFMRAQGFDLANAADIVKARNEGAGVNEDIDYRRLDPISLGDGAVGAFSRGIGDPFNVLDEAGGVVDAFGLTQGRENVFNSDRSLGDLVRSNIDVNRAILGGDERDHFAARLGGQLATGIVLPIGAGARTVGQLAKVGAVEGAAAGFGAGEGDPLQRAPSTVAGAVFGGTGGAVLGKAIDAGAPLVRRAFGRSGEGAAVAREAAFEAAPIVNDGAQNAGPTPAARTQPQGGALSQPQRGVMADIPAPPASEPVAAASTAPQAIERARPAAATVKANNHIRPLSHYAPVVYREMSLDDAGYYLPLGDMRKSLYGDEFVADTPDLATGQGSNTGVLFEFDAAPLQGQVHTSKPGWDFAWDNGAGEYVVRYASEGDFKDAVRAFTVKPTAKTERGNATLQRWRRMLDRHQRQGWTRTVGEDGSITMRRPVPVDRAAAMDSGIEAPTLTGPASRQRDYIRVDDLPEGFTLAEPALGRVRPMGEQASADDIAAAARRVDPEDVTPIPGNQVESLDEAARANPGTQRLLKAPDERAELASRRIPSREDLFRASNRKGPLDLVAFLRRQGGLKDEGGDLAHMGLDNAPRDLDFARNEQFLGKLVDPERGLGLDEAAFRAWEAGYMPGHAGRPTVREFLDVLRDTHSGVNRAFLPGDLDEIARFEAARAERGRVETAAQEGSPLADDVGQPIELSDLDALDPPATAYEDLPKVGGKVGNINVGNLETRADIRRALMTSENRVGGFDAAKRGKMAQAETSALASELGLTPDDLLRRRKGQALNAEQALAARRILAKSADEMVTLARKVQGGSDEDLATFRKAWVRHVAIQEQVTAATAEAGRALASFKILARSRDVRGRVLDAVIQGGGGRDRIEDVAEAILDLQRDPSKLNAFARLANKPTWKDKAVELWYNSLLSGPATHAVNVLSNAMTAGLQLPEMATASAIGGARAAARKLRGKEDDFDRVVRSEIGARTVGMMQGTREGLRAFARTLKTGEVPDMVTKVESRSQRAISGVKGDIIRIPTRLLAAEDELFKAIARRMEIAGLATRKARSEGLKGDAFKERVAALTASPTDDMVESSLDYARYVTYQRPLGPIGQAISRITMDQPWLKLFVPFIRTPTNIFKFVAERSPAAPLMKHVRADLKAGGAKRDLAAARMMLGTGLGLLVTEWASKGIITGGGPVDDNAKALMRADGWQPYSIRIGDKYYSYQRLDPLASTLGIAADLVDVQTHMTEGQRQKATALVVAAIIKNMANKTWLSGVTNVSNAVSDPGRYGEGLVAQLVGSIAVPTLVNQITRTTDPVLREARAPIDRIKSRLPGLSKTLPARRDVWGEEIVTEGGLGPDIASPIWQSTARNDPVNAELIAIGAGIGKPSREVRGRRLSAGEYGELQKLSGQYLRADIEAAMSEPGWKEAPSWERAKVVKKLKDRARDDARADLFPEEPDMPEGFAVAQ